MVEEITIQELAQMEPSACQIIDMRDETAFALGHIDGAVLIPQKELETSHGELPRDKMLVIYCRSGILSADMAEQLRDEGYQAVNLVGGYVQWLQDKIRRETKNEKVAEVEQGLRKKFHRVIFSRFAKAIKTYDLIQPNDRIAVCGPCEGRAGNCFQHPGHRRGCRRRQGCVKKPDGRPSVRLLPVMSGVSVSKCAARIKRESARPEIPIPEQNRFSPPAVRLAGEIVKIGRAGHRPILFKTGVRIA